MSAGLRQLETEEQELCAGWTRRRCAQEFRTRDPTIQGARFALEFRLDAGKSSEPTRAEFDMISFVKNGGL